MALNFFKQLKKAIQAFEDSINKKINKSVNESVEKPKEETKTETVTPVMVSGTSTPKIGTNYIPTYQKAIQKVELPRKNSAIEDYLLSVKESSKEDLNLNSLTGINELQKELITKKSEFKSAIDNLYSTRNNFYNNLITSEIGYNFLKTAEIHLSNYMKSYSICSFINDEEINDNLTSLTNCYKMIETDSSLENIINPKIKEIKTNLSKNIEIAKELLEDTDSNSYSNTDIYATVENTNGEYQITLYTVGDILKENGTADYPYLIRSNSDMTTYAGNLAFNDTNDKYYLLTSDITTTKNIFYGTILGRKNSESEESRKTLYFNSNTNATFILNNAKNIDIVVSINGTGVIKINGILENVNFLINDKNNLGTTFIFGDQITQNDTNFSANIYLKEDGGNKERTVIIKSLVDISSNTYLNINHATEASKKYIAITHNVNDSIDYREKDFKVTKEVRPNKNKSRIFYNEDYIPRSSMTQISGSMDANNYIEDTSGNGTIRLSSTLMLKDIKFNLDENNSFIVKNMYLNKIKDSNEYIDTYLYESEVITPKDALEIYLLLCSENNDSASDNLKHTIKFIRLFSKLNEIETNRCKLSIETTMKLLDRFTTIESYRQNNDPIYNDSISSNLKNIIYGISEEIPALNTDLDDYNKALSLASLQTNFYLAIEESKNDIIGLCRGIININNFVNDYSILSEPSSAYGNKLKNSLVILDDAIQETKLPLEIRSFKNWIEKYNNFSFDGPYAYSQLYIGQELGLNALRGKNDDESSKKALKHFVFNSLIETFKKGLFKNENIIKSDARDIIVYEADLCDNNILLNEFAIYENIPPIILNMIGTDINYYDISDILIYLDDLDDNKFYKLISFAYIKYIFANKNNPKDICNRIIKIAEAFEKSRCNFKTLLCEFYFYKLLGSIYGFMTTNQTIIDPYENDIYKTYTNGNEKVEKLVNKYLYLWNFYYSSIYTEKSLYINKIFNNNLINFLYETGETENPDKITITVANFNTKLNAIWDKIKEY